MSSTPAPRPDAALLAGVLDAVPAPVCLVARDRRILHANRAFADFAQAPAAAIPGQPLAELLGPHLAAWLDPSADRALAGEVVQAEGWTDAPGQPRRFLAWTLAPQPDHREAFALFLRDLTAERQREEAAETSRQQLRAILEGVADGVNIVGPDARLVLANAGFLAMYDFPPHLAAPGTPVADFIRNRLRRADLRPEEDPCAPEEALVLARVAEIMARPPGRQEETRPDGRVIELRTARLEDGTLVNTYSDLTLRREAERARAASREALRRHERLSAIASLLAGVAHEINNPLAVVAAQSLLLAEEAEGTALAARAEKVRLAAERCGRIVASLLASARQKPPKREWVDLAQVVETGLDLTELARAGVELVREVAAPLPPIRGDADQLAHLVANLVGNACAALAGHAPPSRDWRPRVRLAVRVVAAWVELRVADNGPGIPEALRERVFDPFFTTKPDGEGTGVGLALCRTIAQAHGGSIAVEALPGGGAVLVVRLPGNEAARAKPRHP
ncbi:PAS-domain containing protein [Falsiroseomonas sp.]|uniref:sensor histidine kinase n=1 Tax=Falsiroseomonas sp. TaxID=2870721 RepID=UPI003F711FA3